MRLYLSVFFAVLIVFTSEVSWALAGDLGGMTGTVTNARTGTPIGGVRLQISSRSGAATATTDAKGHFAALSLPPDDNYSISLDKDGYYPRTLTGFAVYADQTQPYDLQLYPSASVSPTAAPAGWAGASRSTQPSESGDVELPKEAGGRSSAKLKYSKEGVKDALVRMADRRDRDRLFDSGFRQNVVAFCAALAMERR